MLERHAGFRLQRLEVFNWGTFGEQVWTLDADGNNSLLTGGTGSGKSTLVDAITTLLMPAQRIAYNKAAGADSKERSLRSYVLGHYKSERDPASGAVTPVALRDQNSHSILLAVFHSADHNQTITLAQIFWIRDGQTQPARCFVGAERALSIATDFAGPGPDQALPGTPRLPDLPALRKHLRGLGATVMESFASYAAWFRPRLGIRHEQALDLFYQTISMKSIGNLTDFVRSQLLDAGAVDASIAGLIDHFAALHQAHEAVLETRRQIAWLAPLAGDCERYEWQHQQIGQSSAARDALRHYFSGLKRDVLTTRLAELTALWNQHDQQTQQREQIRNAQRVEADALRQRIDGHDGDQLERLNRDIDSKSEECTTREHRARRYAELVRAVGATPADNAVDFLDQQRHLSQLAEAAHVRQASLAAHWHGHALSLHQGKQDLAALRREIRSLAMRQNNIPAETVAMRAALCQALGVSVTDMPFAGELLQVKPAEQAWEGAAERLLRRFALSLLVPDAHYARVAEWVEQMPLKGRLVYFRVRPDIRPAAAPLHPDSLAHKLAIKPDGRFHDWLEREVAHRFDVACCTTADQFRREPHAITQAGQSKIAGEHHEKNNRHPLHDRCRYVLGWSHAAKLAALGVREQTRAARLAELDKLSDRIQAVRVVFTERLTTLSKLGEHADFRQLDWQSLTREIAGLQQEKQQLTKTAETLKAMTERLHTIAAALAQSELKLVGQHDQRARLAQQRHDLQAQLGPMPEQPDAPACASLALQLTRLAALRQDVAGELPLTLASCEAQEHLLRDWLQQKIDSAFKKRERLRDKIVKVLGAYHTAFQHGQPASDTGLDLVQECHLLSDRLANDTLPRCEARFQALLKDHSLREIADFHALLAQQRASITQRLAGLNASLHGIDYNPGRYIALEAYPAPDADVRDFQAILQACSDATPDHAQSVPQAEMRFLQIKQLIGRFRGGDGDGNGDGGQDRRWTAKVTDVRNWFEFAASERWREDDHEQEHYADAGGKSGGQKEKLAYTLLAASLACRYGPGRNAAGADPDCAAHALRLVVIDEAFGRGSDASTDYGLRLFTRLDLQLLIVTPLQKISVIAPFVARVGLVRNAAGDASSLQTMTVDEFRAETLLAAA